MCSRTIMHTPLSTALRDTARNKIAQPDNLAQPKNISSCSSSQRHMKSRLTSPDMMLLRQREMRITSSNVLHQPKGLQGTPFRRNNPCTAVMSLRHRRRGVEGEAGRQRRRTCGLSCFLTSSRLELFLGFLLFLQLHLVPKFLLHSKCLRFVSSSRHRHLAQSRFPLLSQFAC